MLAKINSVLTEERYRDYLPLTDDQKKAMSEDDIKLWEQKAKSGLLRSDSILENIVTNLRRALYDKVEGCSLSLYQIGITTGSYQDKGKLVIDEEKLRAALTDNYDAVVQLFTQGSQYTYSEALNDPNKRAVRYKEAGIAQRIYDILQDNIRITRNANGKKGILLEKAGIAGDLTEYDNLIVNEIKAKEIAYCTLLCIYTTFMKKAMDKNTHINSGNEIAASTVNDPSFFLSSSFKIFILSPCYCYLYRLVQYAILLFSGSWQQSAYVIIYRAFYCDLYII